MIRLIVLTYCFLTAWNCYSFHEGDSTTSSTIQLNHFEAVLAKKIVHFKWEVGREKKGDYFLIEKSINKKEWKQVSKVESIGNHENRHTYSISEINFAEGPEEFFRISRVDVSGKKEILDLVSINQPILQNMLLIPIKGKANKLMILSFDSMIASRGKITIMNEDGDIVFIKTILQIDGYNRYVLPIRNLNPGKFHVLIRDEYNNTISKNLTIYRKRK